MFTKKGWKEGDYVFASKPNGDHKDIVVGIVTGIENSNIGVNGMIINPVGLKNKVSQGKAGPQSLELLKNPNPKECIFALIYRVEHNNFTGVFDVTSDPVEKIHKNIQNIISGWVRGAIPELINNRSEEHTSELQSRRHLVCRLLLEKKKKKRALNNHK